VKLHSYGLGILAAAFCVFILGNAQPARIENPARGGNFQRNRNKQHLKAYQTPTPETLPAPFMEWIDLIGGETNELIDDAAMDSQGNIYFIGNSRPLEYKYAESNNEILLWKMNAEGQIEWQKVLPASPESIGMNLIATPDDRIYIGGLSTSAWGNPVEPYHADREAFLAEIDPNGSMLWSTFVGAGQSDFPYDLAVNNEGDIYFAIESTQEDTLLTMPTLAKLDPTGHLQWLRPIETEANAFFYDIMIAPDGNIYSVGQSDDPWGDPIQAFSGDYDGFIAKIDSEGNLLWHTFLGGTGEDDAFNILLDSEGNIYNCGYSNQPWGSPLIAHTGDGNFDPYIAKTDPNGNLLWHTFIGTTGDDIDAGFIYNATGNFLLYGTSTNTWGTPFNAHAGGAEDGFIAEFDLQGNLVWNTFYGSTGSDGIRVVLPVGASNLLIAGSTDGTFGNPGTPPSGGDDIFVANINLAGEPPAQPAPVEEPGNPYRASGPYVPELSRYIPTPQDISPDPQVIGGNVFAAIFLMLPFAVAVDLFTRLLTQNESGLIERFAFVAMINEVQRQARETLQKTTRQNQTAFEILGLIGITIFYGLVFTLLDKTWNPFTLKGLLFLAEMIIAFGIVGILDDLLQWRQIRKWKIEAELTVRPTNVFIALVSLGTSRVLSLLPGLMFGSPEAIRLDEEKLTRQQTQVLTRISSTTYGLICIGAWGLTSLTTIIKDLPLSENLFNLISGLEGFLLIIFAVALENIFVQLLDLSEGLGRKIKKNSRPGWIISLVSCSFIFLHTLLNPRNGMIESLQQGKTALFIGVAATFIILTFVSYFISTRRKRKADLIK